MKTTAIVLVSAALSMGTGMAKPPTLVQATLAAPDGTSHGRVTVNETTYGLRIVYRATGLPPGPHGVHIHAVGKCEAPKFESAGPHWNPAGKQHGTQNPMGPHKGDLPNLKVAKNGTGTLSFTLPKTKLSDMLDADGAAFVVHAAADDLKTDPSGNSGGRIACGVFTG